MRYAISSAAPSAARSPLRADPGGHRSWAAAFWQENSDATPPRLGGSSWRRDRLAAQRLDHPQQLLQPLLRRRAARGVAVAALGVEDDQVRHLRLEGELRLHHVFG